MSAAEGNSADGIRCTVCATFLGPAAVLVAPVSQPLDRIENDGVGATCKSANGEKIEAYDQLIEIQDTTIKAGYDGGDEKRVSCSEEQASAVPAEETSNALGESDDNKSQPFIALACTGKCAKQENPTDLTNTNNENSMCDGGGYTYYCVPDCFEHFLQHHWGIYSGLGQAHDKFLRGPLGGGCERCRSDLRVADHCHGSLSLEAALTATPKILSKAFAIFHTATTGDNQQDILGISPKNQNSNEAASSNTTDEEKEELANVRRITQGLEEDRLLKCPSCHYPIAVPEDRGCDAGWCEHCGRALCLYCLTDCGDHPKTDPTAKSYNLIGDAHDHVINNDCGLTAGKGQIHSGKNLIRYHERQFRKRAGLRLKRVSPSIRERVCRNLAICPESLNEIMTTDNPDDKGQSLTKLRREMENDKWEHYPSALRIKFLHAAYQGDFPMVCCLLNMGIPHSIPDAVKGQTALHFASAKGHSQIVKHLLEQGANPWQLCPSGRTALDDLCNIQSTCDLETARRLIPNYMVSVPAIFSALRIAYPWLRPWPNGVTALSSAEENHADSPVSSYFSALQENSYRLCKACATGQTEKVEMILSNTTGDFPRLDEETEKLQLLPPACDIVWIYNQGSGCTPLLDLCAKSLKLSPQHVLETAKMILDAVETPHDEFATQSSTSTRRVLIQRLLQMRDFKFNATVLHFLALDPRPQMIRIAGLFLQHAGHSLAQSIDRRGLTVLDWARNYAVMPENPAEEDDSVERQRHIGRWEVLMLAWEEAS